MTLDGQVVPVLEKAGRGLRCLAGELTCVAAIASTMHLATEGANRSGEQFYGGGHLQRCARLADGGGVDLTREHTGVAHRALEAFGARDPGGDRLRDELR